MARSFFDSRPSRFFFFFFFQLLPPCRSPARGLNRALFVLADAADLNRATVCLARALGGSVPSYLLNCSGSATVHRPAPPTLLPLLPPFLLPNTAPASSVRTSPFSPLSLSPQHRHHPQHPVYTYVQPEQRKALGGSEWSAGDRFNAIVNSSSFSYLMVIY